ncbi:hypothetical protein SUGI_0236900 [Cryptomeria japonica]|nr:hypothetical protein SUGI_0236900 [Cryptomeria japonica]
MSCDILKRNGGMSVQITVTDLSLKQWRMKVLHLVISFQSRGLKECRLHYNWKRSCWTNSTLVRQGLLHCKWSGSWC